MQQDGLQHTKGIEGRGFVERGGKTADRRPSKRRAHVSPMTPAYPHTYTRGSVVHIPKVPSAASDPHQSGSVEKNIFLHARSAVYPHKLDGLCSRHLVSAPCLGRGSIISRPSAVGQHGHFSSAR